ncbi:hypothetical protein BDM02DRAFT_1677188 [Thelephora ganbajun]|uniref:Uncharacterized protein n=1 Tax=Thelephora ganbajun TaxID=370292 RepID=A0ACB6ZWU7_THEGA|nr:hypothetical protein BDM02DRAFT_1677188 [Thelephora ganbajun]
MDQPPSAVHPIQVRSDSASKQPRKSASHHSLSHQQMQQLQDIKPALLPNTTHRQRFTYKDKFQALRDRYEQVSATNEALRKELSIAEEKMQKLEAENNLLIDGIGIVAPFSATIEQFLASQNSERPSPLSPPMPRTNGTTDDRGGLQMVNGHSKNYPTTTPVADSH